jgi:hypothetical protein
LRGSQACATKNFFRAVKNAIRRIRTWWKDQNAIATSLENFADT